MRATLLDARDLLFPEGIAFINLNYSAEAGIAEVTRHRLAAHKGVQELLAQLHTLENRSLADEVTGWLDAGDHLRQLEVQRRQFEQGSSTPQPSIDRTALTRARNRWIRVVNALTNSIDLDDVPDENLHKLLLAPLSEALSRAENRSKRAASKPSPAKPPGEPVPDPKS